MARHEDLSDLTGIKVYFTDPYSPWQRHRVKPEHQTAQKSRVELFMPESFDFLKHHHQLFALGT